VCGDGGVALCGLAVVATDRLAEQVLDVMGHEGTVEPALR
jgi:hypothetical protein